MTVNILLLIALLGYMLGCFEGLKDPRKLIMLSVIVVIIYTQFSREGFSRIETKESCKSQGLEFDPVDDKCVKPIK